MHEHEDIPTVKDSTGRRLERWAVPGGWLYQRVGVAGLAFVPESAEGNLGRRYDIDFTWRRTATTPLDEKRLRVISAVQHVIQHGIRSVPVFTIKQEIDRMIRACQCSEAACADPSNHDVGPCDACHALNAVLEFIEKE